MIQDDKLVIDLSGNDQEDTESKTSTQTRTSYIPTTQSAPQPKYSDQELDRVIQQYNDLKDIINEDSNKLNAITAKYSTGSSIPTQQYLYYAQEYTLQLQYSINHLNTFREFIDSNDEILEYLGVDVYATKMLIDDVSVYYQAQTQYVSNQLQAIQYNQAQQQAQQEELLNLLMSLLLL